VRAGSMSSPLLRASHDHDVVGKQAVLLDLHLPPILGLQLSGGYDYLDCLRCGHTSLMSL
jgi:hypothetical protein